MIRDRVEAPPKCDDSVTEYSSASLHTKFNSDLTHTWCFHGIVNGPLVISGGLFVFEIDVHGNPLVCPLRAVKRHENGRRPKPNKKQSGANV